MKSKTQFLHPIYTLHHHLDEVPEVPICTSLCSTPMKGTTEVLQSFQPLGNK